MLSFLYRLVISVWSPKHIDSSVIDLEEEWIAIISDSEVKLIVENKNRLDDELDLLRRRNSGGNRAFILRQVSEIFSQIDVSSLTKVVLTADLRQKIYKDVFTKLSTEWLEQIKTIYPNLSSIESNWTPSTYEKNLLGQMIDMAEKTGPDHLSAPGFAQMMKNVHHCLVQSLSLLINTQITFVHSDALLEMLIKAIVPIIDIWLLTARNAKDGLTKQGQLPSKWTRELEDKLNLLKEKKEKGEIDARFADGEQDQLRQRYLAKDKIENYDVISQCRNKLHLIDFKTRHAQLERLFKKE